MASTKRIKIDPLNPEQEYLQQAAKVLSDGGLVIIPTETVYGIAANMRNPKALERLYEIKQRPKDKPFSIHIADKAEVEEFARDIPIAAYKLIDKFWPGPLTLILRSRSNGTVGVRMPHNEIALQVIRRANVPVVCPSANISGKTPPVNFEEAMSELEGLVDLGLDGGKTSLGVESSIADMTVEPFKIIRAGAVSEEALRRTAAKKFVLFICTGNSCRSVMAEALLKKMLKEKKRDDVEVISAGIMMLGGLGATEATREVLGQEGIDVSGHRSQGVTKEMVRKSDIIFAMERKHEERILELAPEVKNRLFLLREFAKIDNDFDIPDPIGKPLEFYESTFALIKAAVERVAAII